MEAGWFGLPSVIRAVPMKQFLLRCMTDWKLGSVSVCMLDYSLYYDLLGWSSAEGLLV